jgi:1-acyl-sn-glycerol-3-phosphate acyltransferase
MLLRALSRAGSTAWATLGALGQARAQSPDIAAGAQAFHRLCARLCTAHDFRLVVEGAPPPGPHVLVTNHLSYLDPIVLCARYPLAPIAKAEVDDWPLIGACGRAHGVMFVRRAEPHSGAVVLRNAARALAAGVPVLNFPEGTTTDGGPLLPFKRGIFGLAGRAGVPVVPAALIFADPAAHWVGGELFLPHYFRTAARPGMVVTIRYGVPLDPRRVSARLVAEAARVRVAALLDDTPPLRMAA